MEITKKAIAAVASKDSSWKTTLLGLLSAVGYALYQYIQNGGMNKEEAVTCVVWAVFCFFVKDRDTSTAIDADTLSRLKKIIDINP